jgi:hypothetical protein
MHPCTVWRAVEGRGGPWRAVRYTVCSRCGALGARRYLPSAWAGAGCSAHGSSTRITGTILNKTSGAQAARADPPGIRPQQAPTPLGVTRTPPGYLGGHRLRCMRVCGRFCVHVQRLGRGPQIMGHRTGTRPTTPSNATKQDPNMQVPLWYPGARDARVCVVARVPKVAVGGGKLEVCGHFPRSAKLALLPTCPAIARNCVQKLQKYWSCGYRKPQQPPRMWATADRENIIEG